MPPVGFEPTGERPQTYALDRAATGTRLRGRYIKETVTPEIQSANVAWYQKRKSSYPDFLHIRMTRHPYESG